MTGKPSMEWMANYLATHDKYRVYIDDDDNSRFEWMNHLWNLVQGLNPDLCVRMNAEEDPRWMEIFIV